MEAVSPTLLQYLCENTRSMVMDKACIVVVSDILGAAVCDLRPAMEAVAQLAAEDFVAGGAEGQVCYGRNQRYLRCWHLMHCAVRTT